MTVPPNFEIRDDGIYKIQEVATYEKNPRHKTVVAEQMMPKEIFINAFNQWIKDPNSSGCEDK